MSILTALRTVKYYLLVSSKEETLKEIERLILEEEDMLTEWINTIKPETKYDKQPIQRENSTIS